jgi:hypothetical protein
MIEPKELFGQLGNQMFQMAFLYSMFLDGKIPDFYLQDEQYFARHSSRIKALYRSGIGRIEKVAIHVRRTDYVDNRFYVDLMKTDYYERAMKEFPNAQFLVFSDDINWCKQQPIFKDCEFSEGLNRIDDLNRMASCIGHIIANSSYSWWGAYLSPNRGLVIAPKAWYNDGEERTKLPAKWKRI